MHNPKWIWIRLAEIKGIHPDVAEIARLADEDYLVSSVSIHPCHTLDIKRWLHLHPIMCVKHQRHWHVSGGFRSWQTAVATLPQEEEVPILTMGRTNAATRQEWASVDTIITPMVMSLGKGGNKAIGATWQALCEINPAWSKKVFSDCNGLRAFARRMKLSYNSLFSPGKSNE